MGYNNDAKHPWDAGRYLYDVLSVCWNQVHSFKNNCLLKCVIYSYFVHRYNSSYTKMIGAICGLGYNPETCRPLFEDNDIEITFDTVIDLNFLNKVN